MAVIKQIRNSLAGTLAGAVLPDNFYFAIMGYCPCCEKNVTFYAYDSWLRDFFLCGNCQSLPRERALMTVIEQYFPNWRELKIHESSPVNRGTSVRLKRECKEYQSSQFYPENLPGAIVDGNRNENLEAQTFEDASFDLVITQDVMEHIFNPGNAFAEIARTLKKGGAHIFTVPLVNRHKPSEVWAVLEDGKPKFLQKPEYHGNPVNPEGCPVTMHWGFDIVDFIKAHSGLNTTIEHLDDLGMGIRAEYIEVLISK